MVAGRFMRRFAEAASHAALISMQRLLFERNPAGLLARDAEFNNTPLDDWAVHRNTHPVPFPPDLLQLLLKKSASFSGFSGTA